MSENKYKRLVLDPRCLQPSNEVKDRYVYTDALEAVRAAIDHPHATPSEKNILESMLIEIRKNRFITD